MITAREITIPPAGILTPAAIEVTRVVATQAPWGAGAIPLEVKLRLTGIVLATIGQAARPAGILARVAVMALAGILARDGITVPAEISARDGIMVAVKIMARDGITAPVGITVPVVTAITPGAMIQVAATLADRQGIAATGIAPVALIGHILPAAVMGQAQARIAATLAVPTWEVAEEPMIPQVGIMAGAVTRALGIATNTVLRPKAPGIGITIGIIAVTGARPVLPLETRDLASAPKEPAAIATGIMTEAMKRMQADDILEAPTSTPVDLLDPTTGQTVVINPAQPARKTSMSALREGLEQGA